MNDLASAMGAQIRKIRKKCGLTLESLSEKADLSPVFLSDVERGRKEPSVTTLRKIATALGVKIAYLVKPVEPKTSERETYEILADEPAREVLLLLEGKSTYQVKTATRVLKSLFEEEKK